MMAYLEIAVGLFTAVAVIMLFAFYTAYHRRGWSAIADVLIPDINNVPLSAEVAAIIVHPLFWIISLGIITFFTVSITFSINLSTLGYDWLAFAFSLVIFFALFDPLVIWFSEGKYREPLRFVLGSLSYGALCALIAFFINSVAGILLDETLGQKMSIIALIAAAPLVEETLKHIGVILVSGHKMFRGPLDGILIGFSIGAGFAMVENIFYITNKIPEHSVELLIFRALYNTIAHGSFTAIGGAVLGKIKQGFRRPNIILLFFVPMLTAALTHIAFNMLAIVDVVGVNSLVLEYYVFSPLMVVALLLIVGLLIFYSWEELRGKMKEGLEKLGVNINLKN